MCKLFVVNSLYLGNRSLGLELWDGKGIVEMTEKQVRDNINAGKEIYGLKVAANGIDLEIDREGFYMNNLVAHRHIGNYKPCYETENPVSIMYIVTGSREVNSEAMYDIISSRFEFKAVNSEMLKSLFLMGAVCGGAKMEDGNIVIAEKIGQTEPEKVKQPVDNNSEGKNPIDNKKEPEKKEADTVKKVDEVDKKSGNKTQQPRKTTKK